MRLRVEESTASVAAERAAARLLVELRDSGLGALRRDNIALRNQPGNDSS
jgi:3'-phosphoadenosine 5'-phosphosulfate sulfotransferase